MNISELLETLQTPDIQDLTELDLGSNQLTSLPTEIKQLTRLSQYFCLASIRFEHLEKSMGR